MFYVIDISQNPPVKIEGTESINKQDCIDWIITNGDIINYSIEESN